MIKVFDLSLVRRSADSLPHGVRAKYNAGCKCALCRAANSRYVIERCKAAKAGDWNGIVSASRAKRHLIRLGKSGVGLPSVAKASGVDEGAVKDIRMGYKKKIRARTEKKLLAVDESAMAAHTAAWRVSDKAAHW